MGINSLTGFGGFYNYRQMEIPQVDVETVRSQDQLKQSENQIPAVSAPEAVEAPEAAKADLRPRHANLDDVSLTFRKNDDYAFLGSESDIHDLDMQKAISDMQKDKVFQDYQFFVGTSADVKQLLDNEDGKIVIK